MANRIRHSLGEQGVHKITGQPLHPMFSLYKIAAGVEAGTRHLAQYMCLDAFVATRLGARPATDYTMAARTGALDIHRLKWSEDMLAAATDACGSLLSPDIFPDIVSAGTVTGHVSREAASRTGLIQGTPIVAGVHDQTASFLGAGGRASEKSVFALGSSDCLTLATPSRPDFLEDTGFASYPLAPHLWITLAGTAAGGWALEWLASIVGEDLPGLFNRLPKTPPPLLVLPYMVGSGTLDNDPSAKGVIAGLTLNTTKEELGRAFVEAAGFELAKIVDALEQRHIKVGEIVAVGSGSANSHALDIRASAAGVPLQPFAGHASARGAGLVAGMGVGLFPDLNSLPLADTGSASIPDPMHLAWYARQRSHYADLYRATLETTHSLDLRS
jgi:xylulokinase